MVLENTVAMDDAKATFFVRSTLIVAGEEEEEEEAVVLDIRKKKNGILETEKKRTFLFFFFFFLVLFNSISLLLFCGKERIGARKRERFSATQGDIFHE